MVALCSLHWMLIMVYAWHIVVLLCIFWLKLLYAQIWSQVLSRFIPCNDCITLLVFFQAYMLGIPDIQLMWLSFGAVIIIKGLNYALNVPSKEVLYIPTSKDVKFKAKGWIDAFGNRTTKLLGATVTNPLRLYINAYFLRNLGITRYRCFLDSRCNFHGQHV